MKAINVACQKRDVVGSTDAKNLRRDAKVPGVVYGGQENIHFYADIKAFKDLIFNPAFAMAELDIDGHKVEAVVKDTQFHPLTDELTHIDFLQLVPGKPLIVEIPVRIKGRSKGVAAGGKLMTRVRKLRVKATPDQLCDYIDVDVTDLELNQSIKVGDLIDKVGGIEILNPNSIPVATVVTTRALRSAATKAAKGGK